jgi:antirestriction protein ArdC
MNVRDVVLQSILDALESGMVPWHCPWNRPSARPMNLFRRRRYSGVNWFLLSLSGYLSGFGPYWLTLREVHKLGGRVLDNEFGCSVRVVIYKPLPPKDADEEDENKRQRMLLRNYSVYNHDQTEDIELPEDLKLTDEHDHDPIISAEAIAFNMPNPPQMQQRGQRAYYRPADDLVVTPPRSLFHTVEAYYATLFHELGHSTGHNSRLHRPEMMDVAAWGDASYSREELVAEITAAMLCAKAGIDPQIESSAGYIQSWLHALQGDKQMVLYAAAKAEQAAAYILGRDRLVDQVVVTE